MRRYAVMILLVLFSRSILFAESLQYVVDDNFPRLTHRQIESITSRVALTSVMRLGHKVEIERNVRTVEFSKTSMHKFAIDLESEKEPISIGLYEKIRAAESGNSYFFDIVAKSKFGPAELSYAFENYAAMHTDEVSRSLALKAWSAMEPIEGVVVQPSQIWQYVVFWQNMPMDLTSATVTLVNFPIVDLSPDSPIHTIIRGGQAFGYTRFPGAGSNAQILVSHFAVSRMAKPKSLVENIVLDLIVHELGHAYLDLPDDYGNSACIMYPVQQFKFEKWQWGLRNNGCALRGGLVK